MSKAKTKRPSKLAIENHRGDSSASDNRQSSIVNSSSRPALRKEKTKRASKPGIEDHPENSLAIDNRQSTTDNASSPVLGKGKSAIEDQPKDSSAIDNRQSTIVNPSASPESRVPSPALSEAVNPPESEPPTGKPVIEIVEPELRHPTILRPYQTRWTNEQGRFAIAVKSAQIGFSTASAAWAVHRCLRMPKRTIIFLSRSERQSRELAEKAKQWLEGYHGVAALFVPDGCFEGTSVRQHEIRFENGSRIVVLAANPDTARGYTGDVVLDEFAFHQDSQSIFTAVYRQVSLGYSMRVLSTPNGPQGKFYELAKSLNFDLGVRPVSQPVRVGFGTRDSGRADNTAPAETDTVGSGPRVASRESRVSNPWSGHWVDIHLAVQEGCPLDVGLVQAGCDPTTWLQEYCCQFVSEGSTWISPELYQSCVSSEASTDLFEWIGTRDSGLGTRRADHRKGESLPESRLYAGWDIARNHDLSVIWLTELVGDVTWTRGVVEMRDLPTPEQIREARSLMPFVRRMEIDKGGMGLAIYEALARDFPSQVEGLQFSAVKKETMAVLAKRRMEEGKVRLPDREPIRQSFRAVRKSVNSLGQARFDAEHDSRYGHADHWWAFCLAEAAAEQPSYRLRHVGGLVGEPLIPGFGSTGLVPSESGSVVPERGMRFAT